MRGLRIGIATTATALALGALGAGSASAAFGIAAFDGGAFGPGGAAFNQAGGHPDNASTSFRLDTEELANTVLRAKDGVLDNVRASLPAGLVGNPSAVTRCPATLRVPLLSESYDPLKNCPMSSMVGVAYTTIGYDGRQETKPSAIFNVEPNPGVAAAFAFEIESVTTLLQATLRDNGDYGIDVEVDNVNTTLNVIGSEVTIWGSPASSIHDGERCGVFLPIGVELINPPICIYGPGEPGGPGPAGIPEKAFLTNPTACTAPGEGLESRLRVRSYAGAEGEASFESHNPPGYTPLDPQPPANWGPAQGPSGCDQVPFEPELGLRPSSQRADSPTGLTVDLSVPTEGLEDPARIAQSHLKKAVVTLPEGMTVNPSSAAGLGSCSPAQLAAETSASGPGAGCPLDSKIGTVTVDTPLLAVHNELGEAQRDAQGDLIPESLGGSVYLAKQGDNPFGSLLALYLVVKSPERGIVLKLPGKVDADPNSGRLTATFDDNPQLPFSNLHLEFKSGARAPLVTPRECGTYSIESDLYPWARPNSPVHSTSTFKVSSGPDGAPCPSPGRFDPGFQAGTLTPIAGIYSPLIVNASRSDGAQPLAGLSLELPPGLLGKLAGVPYCSEAALAAAAGKSGRAELSSPSCPAASQIGTVDVGAGAGPTPFHVQGKAYLAGPYKRGPISIATITPAVAGPFDLGTVVVRARAEVDPVSAAITVASDSIPQILQGIPLKLRSISAEASRPEFTLNPTSCDPMSLDGTLFGASASKAVSNRFQVGACGALGFAPKLNLKLRGGTARSAHPSLKAVLRAQPGQANIGRAQVTLPRSAFLEQSHIRTVCTRVQFAADACPKGAIYGKASAVTPLLDQALTGPVYLRSSTHELPDLVADLRGPATQPIRLELAGRIDSIRGGIRTSFESVPDAPVTKFVLTMQGGRKGLIVNSRNLCAATYRANVRLTAQSGRASNQRPKVGSSCKKAAP